MLNSQPRNVLINAILLLIWTSIAS